jgi:hypothetical protein
MNSGILTGKAELRLLIEKVTERKPFIRKHFKQNFFTDGKTLIFEYPRQTPDGEQMDFMEVMEINDGLIQYHRGLLGMARLSDYSKEFVSALLGIHCHNTLGC